MRVIVAAVFGAAVAVAGCGDGTDLDKESAGSIAGLQTVPSDAPAAVAVADTVAVAADPNGVAVTDGAV
jgi:hypothetical protein